MPEAKDKDPYSDRRKFVRVDIYAVTRYLCPIRKHEVSIPARLSNISEGGVLLLTFEEGIPVGTEISINFVIPNAKEDLVKVKAKIRHTGLLEKSLHPAQDLYRSGAEYISLDDKNERIIREYVSSKLKETKGQK